VKTALINHIKVEKILEEEVKNIRQWLDLEKVEKRIEKHFVENLLSG
jgi:hypothetical protein